MQVNQTNQDWNLAATLEGVGFYGPPVMVAKSHLTTNYPLMFKPCYEGPVEVRDYFIGAWFVPVLYVRNLGVWLSYESPASEQSCHETL